MRTINRGVWSLSKRKQAVVRNQHASLIPPYGSRLVPVACGCIEKGAPTGDFALSHGEYVHPFAPKLLFRFTRSGFCIAQYRHVFTSLDEFSRLEDGGIIGSIDSSKKFGYFGWISPQAGTGQTRRANLFPINFVGNQLQKRRDISATKSCITLLYDIECCAHMSYLEGVLKDGKGVNAY